jgi:glutamate--cysteine ligase
LRMGDLGYTSQAQAALYISYNSLDEYTEGLLKAIRTPYAPYEEFRTEDGSLAQLNANLLQIENEFYSTIRPKRVARSGQRPLEALRDDGVEYLEVRCLDLNPFLPVGIDEEAIRFLNGFLLYCLLHESPSSSCEQNPELDRNQKLVVRQGRDPQLQLVRDGNPIALRDWATEILDGVGEIAAFLDTLEGHGDHAAATKAQADKVAQPDLTPSAQVLERMRDVKTTYFRFAMNQSLGASDYFRSLRLDPVALGEFATTSRESLDKQAQIEAADTEDFVTYLRQANIR